MAVPSQESSDLAPGTLIAEKYRIEALLGRGGMGAVHRAVHTATGRRTALKWMLHPTPEARERMQREARAMGAIDHPNVVQVLDAGEHDGSFFLVMELLRGRTLREIADGRALAPAEVNAILLPAMQGVAAAHLSGLIHRDLKPDNIFVQLDDRGEIAGVKVLDFGIARSMEGESRGPEITRSGSLIGTPKYMAPEQIHGEPPSAQTDVFALGVVTYELLTGRPPFDAERYESLILQIATQTPIAPDVRMPELPAELARAVMKALAREKTERFQDVSAFARALEPFGHTTFVEPVVRESHLPTGPERPATGTPSAVATRRAAPVRSPDDSAAAAPPTVRASLEAPETIATPAVPWTPATRRGPLFALLITLVLVAAIAFSLRPRREPAAPTREAARAPEPAAERARAEAPSAPPSQALVTVPTDAGMPAAPRETTRATPRREASERSEPDVRPAATDRRPQTTEPTAAPALEARGRAGVLRPDDF